MHIRPDPVLALDIGSSSVRASLSDPVLRLRGRQIGYAWRISGPFVELAPHALERIVEQAIDAALAEHRTPVSAVGVAAFWHSLIGLDRAGRAVTPLIPWHDTRADDDAGRLREELSERRLHARTGCRLHASYWPARLRWFRRCDRRRFAAVQRWTTFDAWLQERWLGTTGISVSQASGTGLLAQDACDWDPEICRVSGVDPAALGPILDAPWLDGELRPSLARRWPALARARWLPAVGDGAANNIGAGCTSRRRAAVMIGTSGALRVLWAPRQGETIELPFGLWRYRLDRRHVVAGGALSAGGNVREWVLRTFAAPDDVEARVARMAPDSHGLTVLPFLSGMRSPGYVPDARGTIAGLTTGTTAADVLRASMEAIAFRFAAVFELLRSMHDVRDIVAAGGALERSASWTQLLADVLNRPVLRAGARELTSRGAALLAWDRLGVLSLADAGPPAGRIVIPDRARHRTYVRAMRRQEALMDAVLGGRER